jgi:hypothetical protein
MQILSSPKFVSNRIALAENFSKRVSGDANMKIPDGILESLNDTIEYIKAKDPAAQVAEAQRLFQDDLAAREHDAPQKRLRVAFFLAVGAFLIALPTAVNVALSLWEVIF